MAYDPNNIHTWNLTTPNSGLYLKDEFDRINENFRTIVPVGTIIAWVPGYFTSGSNGGYTPVAVDLPDIWAECNGAELNDADSPLFNGAGRFLPELTDERFLMGSNSPGTAGGNTNNLVTLTESELPSHNHTMDHAHTISHDHSQFTAYTEYTDPQHRHYMNICNDGVGGSGAGGLWRPNASTVTGYNYDSVNHRHVIYIDVPGYSGNSGPSSASNSENTGMGNNFSILPKYLTCKYIMRIK